ncbi:O-antigen ligase family protein [Solirubrobacter phytolaccae]|uniref:O-antigen ligase family protein n=1 Tax=Solirubrobacter phytolaccae TaxID=1404360 RepID=A0A9X3NAE7_9ACTN|nr:O-antigen ligase family protein [Solirubrobacter phytolaccae]MDA0182504.1 O-antigen ligase family protein [Solirubrobacter phytolaccae]
MIAVVATAFASRGGTQLERTTWTQIAIMVVGALLCAAALLLPRSPRAPARFRGGATLVFFTLLAIYTAFSVTWSLMANDSWTETMRTLAYLSAFAGALALGRLAPARWSALLYGIALGAVALSFWSLLTKVFPGWLAPNDSFGRLRPPSDYWNSVGLTAALGVPPLLWLATRRSGHAAFNALAWPGLSIAVMALMLAYSRGSLLALVIGLAVWFALVPLRLRGAVTLGGVVLATLPLVIWASAQDGLTRDGAELAVRIDAGQALGALLLLLIVAMSIAGLAVGFLSSVHAPGERTRVRAGRTLIAAILAVPVVALILLATAPGGISGQVSKGWKQATDPAVAAPQNTPDRLTQASSGRARYWREALKVHAESPWIGTGAGAYGTMRLRYRIDERRVGHAHGYVVQTLSDLGWVGLLISLLAAGAWLVTAARAVGARRKDKGLPWDAERVGIATLAIVVIVFGVHSTFDWTWFVPANALPALICAGWVASRPTLRERFDAPLPEAERRGPFVTLRTRLAVPATPDAPRLGTRPRAGLAVIVVAIALVAAWSALQPIRALHAQNAALARLDIGQYPQAASIAKIAHERNPLSVEPLFELAAIEQARGNREAALRALGDAVEREPANPETWRRLGQTKLDFGDAKGALSAFQAAYYRDPASRRSHSDVVVASRALAGIG